MTCCRGLDLYCINASIYISQLFLPCITSLAMLARVSGLFEDLSWRRALMCIAFRRQVVNGVLSRGSVWLSPRLLHLSRDDLLMSGKDGAEPPFLLLQNGVEFNHRIFYVKSNDCAACIQIWLLLNLHAICKCAAGNACIWMLLGESKRFMYRYHGVCRAVTQPDIA